MQDVNGLRKALHEIAKMVDISTDDIAALQREVYDLRQSVTATENRLTLLEKNWA